MNLDTYYNHFRSIFKAESLFQNLDISGKEWHEFISQYQIRGVYNFS